MTWEMDEWKDGTTVLVATTAPAAMMTAKEEMETEETSVGNWK